MSELIKRRLGRTNFQVTALGLGGFQYVGEFGVPREEGERVLDVAFQAGINYYDTAQMYGFGESEELVGRALRKHGRDKAFVSDKCGWLDRTIVRNRGDEAYQDPAALRRVIKQSMWLMQTDHIDIFMIHEPAWKQWNLNPKTADCVIMEVLESLKKEGAIRAIGMGDWNSDLLADYVETGRFDVVLAAGGYTMLKQPMYNRLVAAAKKHDVGIIVGGAFGQAWTSDLIVKQPEVMQKMIDTGEYREGMDELRARQLIALYQIADELNISMPALTIRFVLSCEDVHCHAAGARCAAHVEDNVQSALQGPLPKEIVDRIFAISKGQL
jgi:aryl-alcohol dehydrogenase-like predicted oxidoreductase